MTSGRSQEKPFIDVTWNQSQTVHTEGRNISDSVELHRRSQNNIFVIGRNVGENIEDCMERIIGCTDRLHKIHLM